MKFLCRIFQQSNDQVRNSPSDDYVRSKAIVYGRESSKKITFYQEQINNASIELALSDPSLLQSRKTLLERARTILNANYKFKKGKSRSKVLSVSCELPPPKKHPRTSDSLRTRHIRELEDDIKDFSDRMQFKDKMRTQAENPRNYRACDQITEEMYSAT